jgi:glycosyltransferase involved in cell wall biosynthesis
MKAVAGISRSLRICRIVTVPFIFETLLREQLEYMAQHGVEMSLVSSPGPALRGVCQSLGIGYCPITMARQPQPGRDLRSLLSLTSLFLRRRFDIVHSTAPKAGLLTALAGALARVPVRIHTFTGQVWVEMHGWSRSMMRWCDWLISHLDTQCYADSTSQRDFLVGEGLAVASKISVLGAGSLSGVNLDRFALDAHGGRCAADLRRELGISEQSLVILFVGRLAKEKGIGELVSVFRMLQAEGKDVDLILVGPSLDSERAPLSVETWQEISRNSRIHPVGFSHEPEKYMGAADVLCLPSYREGFGSAVIEAAAMGVPAVASRVVGLVDAVVDGETGFLAPAKDVEALKEALAGMLSSPEIRHRMGRAARERAVRDFDSTWINHLVLEEYRKLAARWCQR